MRIFEYPYVIITVLVLCFIILAFVGALFAIKGMKTASGNGENDFVNYRRIKRRYFASGKQKQDRCVFYISLDADNYRNLYSKEYTLAILQELSNILAEYFADCESSLITSIDDENFIAFSEWNTDKARSSVDECLAGINKILSIHGAVNLIDIRIGSFFAFGSLVSFDEAVKRAKKACMIAINDETCYAEWDVVKGREFDKKIEIENSIEKEIDNNKFFLEYQPVVDAKTKRIVGAEVLSRLNSESDGVLLPGKFLSAVDSVGLNDKFDYYIFEKNCKWISNDKNNREKYRYTINFSRTTLCEPDFPDKIIEIIEKYGLKYSSLAIEILEDKNVVGEARERMIENLCRLKALGVSILLDDFGSGYTTFGDLNSLDISVVKIDKSITQNAVNETGFIILNNIIKTAKDIGYLTICEGVETIEQEEAVIKAGCDMMQGFYYYKPMPVVMLEKLFTEDLGGV